LVARVAEPCERKSPQAGSLARAQPGQRLLIGADAVLPGAHAAGLDLSEDERAPVEDDQVDLARTCAHVARERGEAEPGQVSGSQVLTEAPECAAGIRETGV
jgi:hypothetical protein